MHLTDLQNKKIGILGFGMEGKAVARFLKLNNLPFSILDAEKLSLDKDSGQEVFNPENIFTGEDYLSHASEFEILFRSPGVKLSEPELEQAKQGGVQITSQIKFFMENTQSKIIGITGTKGKGTTAKLLFEMLQNADMPAHLGGNFGVDVLPLLTTSGPEDYIVLELSSFQLQDLNLSPHIAVVLMVLPEHLDYHKDVAEYVQAKSTITKYQIANDLAVINFDYEYSMEIGKGGDAKKLYVQTVPEYKIEKQDPFSIYKPEEYLKIKNGVFAEQTHGNIYFVENGNLQLLMPASDVPLRGFHNIENVAAASAVARSLGIKENIIIESIQNYKGLAHRLEFVTEKNGIKFYNDSIGTTPQSALAAVKAFHEPVYAILGGADKKADYVEFIAELVKQKNLRGVSLIGEIADLLHNELQKNNFTGQIFTGATSMQASVKQLTDVAEKGDVILLAPATSSFGMFKNYKDRGEQFKAAVEVAQ